MKPLKYILPFLIVTSSVNSLFAAEEHSPLDVASYSVSVGNYYQEPGHGSKHDLDLVDNTDPQSDRKLLLTDGVDHRPQSVVAYTFWGVPDDEAYITVDLILDTEAPVNRVTVSGHNATDAYRVREIEVSESQDGISYSEPTIVSAIEQPSTGNWDVNIDLKANLSKHVRVSAFTGGSNWLGLSAIRIYGTPGSK